MKYELLVIIPAKYSETELPDVVAGVVKTVREAGAEVVSQEDLGKQKLAYSIGAVRFGHALLLKLETAPETAKKLNEQLRLKPEIIRHMITKVLVRKAPAPRAARTEQRPAEPVFSEVSPSATSEEKPLAKEEKTTLEDLDRKLEEILGKETI